MIIVFLRQNARLLAFGYSMCFLSSAGQTFFISLFNGEVRAAFTLSHGELGAMYAAGTIASAATLMFAGRLIDRVALRRFVTLVVIGLAMAAGGMGLIWSPLALPIAFYGLRFFGQGLASHAGITAMARAFDASRGRAIAIASLGYSTGEALLPTIIVAMLTMLSWRTVWFGTAALILLAGLLVAYLAGGRAAEASAAAHGARTVERRHWTLGEVLRDPGLWLRLPVLLAPPFITTGLFFHQVQLAEEKGWALAVIAGSFTAFAATSFVTVMLSGAAVDRFTARRLVPLFLIPMAAGCATLALSASPIAAPIFMVCTGLSVGAYSVSAMAIWPELYGTKHLGAIRGFAQSIMVIASGLSPVLFGMLVDRGVTLAIIAGGCAGYCLLASAVAAAANTAKAVAP